MISIFNKYKLEQNLDEFHLSGSSLYAGEGLVPDVDLASYALQGKLRKIYIENGNTFLENKDLIQRLIVKKYNWDTKLANSIYTKLDDFYRPLRKAKKTEYPDVAIKNIPLDQIPASNIIRIEEVGGVKTFYSLGEELYQIKKNNPSLAPLLSGPKNKTDFNIFISGDNGRRLQPDLTFKLN